jgi:hypothetical protein
MIEKVCRQIFKDAGWQNEVTPGYSSLLEDEE